MTCLIILWQKLWNIPEESLIRHNRKNTQAYDNKIMTSRTSNLNIAIENGKQLIILVTNRRQ